MCIVGKRSVEFTHACDNYKDTESDVISIITDLFIIYIYRYCNDKPSQARSTPS